MTGETKKERVRTVVDRLRGGPVMNALAPPKPQLDISRPNLHDSKAEYLLERATVDKALAGVSDALEALIGNLSEDDTSHTKMFNRLTSVIDRGARHRISGQQPKTATELIRLNAAQNSLSINGLKLLLDFRTELRERLVELQDQEAQFWSVKHHPANYYARAIALRLARIYASEFHKRPTYGSAPARARLMAKRVSKRAIKANRHYTYEDAALKLGNTVQTVRNWSRQGLDVMTDQRPHLILGLDLIAFIEGRQKPKAKMALDQFYCLSCKLRSRPLDGVAFFIPQTASSGRLEAFCGHCEGPCGRFVSARDMPKINRLLEIVMNDAEGT